MLISDEIRTSAGMMSNSLDNSKERPTSFSSRESTISSQSDQSIRSARAAKVFGDLITHGENENSLCYSPSPFPRKQGLSNITNVCQDSPGRVLPFGTIQFTTAKKTVKNQNIHKNCEEGKENEKPQEKSKKKEIKLNPSTIVSNGNGRKGGKSNQLKPIGSRKSDRVKANAQGKKITKRGKPLQMKHRFSSTHEAQASRAQEAIRQATESVNQSINASRIAKNEHNRHVANEVTRLRDEWKAEKEEASRFYAEMQKTKRERLDVTNKISSQYARNKVDSEQTKWQERLAELDKEIKFKSEVYVEHQRKLKDNEDKRRRISVAVKATHRNIRRTNIEKMRLKSIQETHAFYEHKWAGERDAEQYEKKCDQERRASLAFRNLEGRRQREEEAERQVQQKIAEHKQFEHKWEGDRDAEEYRKLCAQQRRESYAFRNAEGRLQRLQEEERQEKEKVKEHQFYELKSKAALDVEEYKKQLAQERRRSYAFRNADGRRQRFEEGERQAREKNAEHERLEHKWAGERDAENYKKQCAQERRESYAFRNAEGRRQRLEEQERIGEEKFKEHEFYEHKWEGERDVEEYKSQCEQDRRESLAFRGQECVRHRAVMEELRALAKEKEHEFYLLKWAAQDNVKEYLAKVAEERRKSLAFRNAEGRRHRQLEEQWRCDELQEAHELEQMRSLCQKDVEGYEKKCAERDRASLCFRGQELQTQKLIIRENQEDQYEEDQQRRELETLARSDVEEYLKDCKRHRRKSLALRAKEHRRHLEWKRKTAQAERKEKSRTTKNAALDRKYVELAKEKERARIALDALRHAQCTFSTSNPFGSLLL